MTSAGLFVVNNEIDLWNEAIGFPFEHYDQATGFTMAHP